MTVWQRSLWLCAVFGLGACAATMPPARTYRYADLVRRPEVGKHAFDQPLVLEFQAGDRLPVHMDFADGNFALEPAAFELALVAQRHCFVRIDQHGIHASTDGRGFYDKPAEPGSFFLGFQHRPTGPSLEVRIRTPRRR